jgi:hypothetical protein
MNRSIEIRLKRLETLMVPKRPPRRSHIVAAPTDEEGDAAIAELIAAGASPDDLFIRLVPFKPDPSSATRHTMTDNIEEKNHCVRGGKY